MSRRGVWLALSLCAIVALSAVSAAGAASSRPTPTLSPFSGRVSPVYVPRGLSNEPTTVVVQLAGDPVSVADANSAAPFSKSERNARRDQLRSQQAPVENQIRALGGQVQASYQLAYNGVKVQIAASKAASLATIPGVTAVRPLQISTIDNERGVALIGAPQVWAGLNGFHGEHIKIADIDTGIDYTHADFGGPGTALAYDNAFATDVAPPDPTLVGPLAAKVKGGVDLVGDDYDAGGTPAQQVPHPDLNPLDCNGHGTHTAGTAAGFGVLDGARYTGGYDASTISSHAGHWTVGPGVAPKADIYAVRIFGCEGSTNSTIDAIEWAVANDMDVINMSLGSPFGSPDSPDAMASTNAARDGVIVIASSGNEGTSAYMTGSPAASRGAVSVAANDPTLTAKGATLTLSTGATKLWSSNNASFTEGLTAGVFVVQPNPGNSNDGAPDVGPIGLGCDPGDYAGSAGKIVLVQRGSAGDPACGRVQRAIYAEDAGAVAAVLVNNAPGYPPIEGDIPNPSTGIAVQIPFFGGLQSDTAKFAGAAGSGTLNHDPAVPNPLYLALASFSSRGPATGDSSLKPNVTAPGVSIVSAGMGKGAGSSTLSGTSMAAPHTTGLAALVKQAHPDWKKVKYWEAAIQNTADPGGINGYSTRGAGVGLVQAVGATQTQVVALASSGRGGNDDDDDHESGRHGGNAQVASLNFGFNELSRDFSQTATVQLRNFSNSPATFNVTQAAPQGRPHTVSFNQSTVTIGPRGRADVRVTLNVPVASAGSWSLPGITSFANVAGLVTLTPASGSNNGVTLRVPYYMVPQAASSVATRIDAKQLRKAGATTATTTNAGPAGGIADWYAWGIKDKRDHGLGSDDIRAVGVDAYPADDVLQFAISTNSRWSNSAQNEFDVNVDVNGDGVPDYLVVAIDNGALTTGTFDGINVTAVFDLNEGGGQIGYVTEAPTDSSTIVLPIPLSWLSDSNPHTSLDGVVNKRITYSVTSFGLTDDTSDTTETSATFNPFSSAVTQGMYDAIPAGGSVTEPLAVNPAEQALSPALGWMVVTHENASGADEAQLIDLK